MGRLFTRAQRWPLVRAVKAKQIILHRHRERCAAVPDGLLDATLPAVLVIEDGDEDATGPAGWACADAVRAWLPTGLPFANVIVREVYAAIVEEAIEHRGFLVIETTPLYLNAWRRWMGGRPEQLELV
jgi:hypothetical protein